MNQSNKKILFIVNGLGMGNSTRSDSIIQSLISKEFLVDVLTSGNGIDYFKIRSYISNLYELRSFYYGSSHGKLSMWKTILAVPSFVNIIRKNVQYIKGLLKVNGYSAIVIDSDYALLLLKKSVRVPIFALNNASIIIEECKNLQVLPKEIRMQYWIEKCDNWFHRTVPDTVLCPAIFYKRENEGASHYFAPFIREGLKGGSEASQLKNILVMLSGSQFGSSTSFLNNLKRREGVHIDVIGREGKSQGWITYHGKVFSNQDFLNKTDMMVVNGGFSAVSEAVVLRKPVVVIPVENHAEQFINACLVEKAGLGISATMDNVASKMDEMIDKFPEYVQVHQKFGCSPDGAHQATEVIERSLAESPSQRPPEGDWKSPRKNPEQELGR